MIDSQRLLLKKANLEIRVGCTTHRYSFDDRYVNWSWEGCSGAGSRKCELSRLTVDPSTVHRKETSYDELKFGIGLCLIAVVVFFSELREMIPLLAPFLTVFGVLRFGIGLYGFRTYDATVFYTWGEEAISLPQTEQIDGDYDEFVKGLRARIEESRSEVFDESSI